MSAVPGTDGLLTDEYLRVSSIAIAIYDYLWTVRTEYRLYKSQESVTRMTRTCILFVLNRYLSIASIIFSNVGFFHTFSIAACSHYYLVSPIFKVITSMVTQFIMGIRAYNISQKRRWVKLTLVSLWCSFSVVEFFVNIYQREHQTSQGRDNCISGDPHLRLAWIHYFLCIIFDGVAIGISCLYLWSYNVTSKPLAQLIHRMLIEGIGYFVIMTAVNVLNLIMYFTAPVDTQSSATSLGYVIAWVMGQRLLINHFEATEESKHSLNGVIALEDARDINQALRSQFDGGFRLNLRDTRSERTDVKPHVLSDPQEGAGDDELGVHVHIEQKVKVDKKGKKSHFMRETYTERLQAAQDQSNAWAGGTSTV